MLANKDETPNDRDRMIKRRCKCRLGAENSVRPYQTGSHCLRLLCIYAIRDAHRRFNLSFIDLWLTPVWLSCPRTKNESTLDPFIPVLRIKAGSHSCLCVTVFNNRAIPYCRLPRSVRCSHLCFKAVSRANLQPLVIFSFFITSSCLFKAALLCNHADGSILSSSIAPHAVCAVFIYSGP